MIRFNDYNPEIVPERADPSIAYIEPGTAMLLAAGVTAATPYVMDWWDEDVSFKNVGFGNTSDNPVIDTSAQRAQQDALKAKRMGVFEDSIRDAKAAGGRATSGSLASSGTSGFIGMNPVLRGMARQGEIQAQSQVNAIQASQQDVEEGYYNEATASAEADVQSAMQITNTNSRRMRLRGLQNSAVDENGKPLEPQYSIYRNAANSV